METQQQNSNYTDSQLCDRFAEKCVLGACIVDSEESVPIVVRLLREDSFYEPFHQRVMKAIVSLSEQMQHIDLVTVRYELKRLNLMESTQDTMRLVDLTREVVTGSAVEAYAQIVRQLYQRRKSVEIQQKVLIDLSDSTKDVTQVLESAQIELSQYIDDEEQGTLLPISDFIQESVKEIERLGRLDGGLVGVPSGFEELDELTGGFVDSQMIIVAARPAMGKTAFSLSMALNMAVRFHTPVALYSLEMGRVEIVKRLLSSESEVENDYIRSGRLTEEQWTKLDEAYARLVDSPLYVNDRATMTILDLRNEILRARKRLGIRCVIVDYLQLLTGGARKGASRYEEVTAISRQIKMIAKEAEIPIIALCQCGRDVEQRGGNGAMNSHRPKLSDLRDSGAIEQDADIVMFLHRPEYYGIMTDEEGQSTAGMAQLIVAKHRNGATKDIRLRFTPKYVKFESCKNANPKPSEVPF